MSRWARRPERSDGIIGRVNPQLLIPLRDGALETREAFTGSGTPMRDCKEAKIIEFQTPLFVSAGAVCYGRGANGLSQTWVTGEIVCIVIGAECNVFV